MDLLLDTHVCVWWAHDPARLVSEATAAIGDPTNHIWISVASAWELAIKVRAGKLKIDVPRLFDELAQRGCSVLGIGVDDAVGAGALEWAHRDPFDRMLAVQARRLGYPLLTRDATLAEFLEDLARPA